MGRLPWVDQKSVNPDVKNREVRFKLADPKGFSEAELVDAFDRVGFPKSTVKHKPSAL